MKNQIAFDYFMIFIFVLVIFTLIFSSIARQRAVFSNQQSYSQLQLVAQDVAAQLNLAEQAGNGYYANFTLPADLSFLQYNISVTKQGFVIVSTNTFGQQTQSFASSSAYSVISNPSAFVSNAYIIPTYTGTGTISFQNSYGTICIDYNCTISNRTSQLIVSQSQSHGIMFNGQDTYAETTNAPSANIGTPVTMSAWVYVNGPSSGQYNWIIAKQYAYGIAAGCSTSLPLYFCYYNWGSSSSVSSSNALKTDTWYFITATVSSSTETVYVNGVQDFSGALSVSSQSYPWEIGYGNYENQFFNGIITNVQVYSSILSQQQVSQLYGEGITGPPISSSGLFAWWPLNGNTNDYSGNGNSDMLYGAQGYVPLSQIQALSIGSNGIGISNSLIGFSATSGIFNGNPSTYNYTNQNGIASAILSQQVGTGASLAYATAFNGNYSYASSNLIAWWPLNLDSEGRIYDIGTNSNLPNPLYGNVFYASQALPNYIADFDGQGSYIQIPGNTALDPSTFTMSAWINAKGPSQGYNSWILGNPGSYNIGLCSDKLYLCFQDLGSNQVSNNPINRDTWYMVSAVVSGTGETVYVNGIQVYSGLAGLSSWSGWQIGNGGCCNEFFNGSISNVQMYTSALTQSQIYRLYSEGIGGSPVTGGIIGWWPLNGNANDYSGGGNNGTIYGNLQFDKYSAQQPGSAHFLAASFNGINSYISDNSIIVPVTNITASAWFNITGNSCQPLLSSSTFSLYAGNSCATSGSFFGHAITQPVGIGVPQNVWVHVSAYYDSATGNALIQYNNVPVASAILPQKLSSQYINAISIGSDGTSHFDGSLSDIQVYSSMLPQQQLNSLYQNGPSSFPVNSSIILWQPLDGNANDYGTYGTNTVSANIIYKTQSSNPPYITPSQNGYGIYFNGQTSKIVINNPAQLSSSGFSVSAWAYPVGSSSSPNSGQEVIGENNAYRLMFDGNGNNDVEFYYFIGGSFKSVIYNSALPLNSWSMLTGTFNGISLNLYVNGIPVNSVSVSGSVPTATNPTVMGASDVSPFNSDFFNGTIADMQLYNTALSAEDVAQLYGAGMPITQSVTVPLVTIQ